MNTKMQETFENAGFAFTFEKKRRGTIKHIKATGRLAATLPILENHKKLPWSVSYNKSHAERVVNTSDNQFCGGTLQDLKDDIAGKVDMAPFHEAKAKFERSSIGEKLREKYANCQPRRQRFMSEHDGEFDESRRCSLAPFQGVKRTTGPARCIDLLAYASVNCNTSADALNRYGCLIWSLVDIIENMGINCRVVLRYDGIRNWDNDLGNLLTVDVECKKAGEYIAPSLLATACKANFFRRAIFGLNCAFVDILEKDVDHALGRSVSHQAIEFKDGQLMIAPEANGANFEDIENVLLQVASH